MIQLNNVSKNYGDHKVLDGIELQINKGEVVVICGPSGSGKSTLIKAINGMNTIDNGTIRLEGIDIKLIEPTSLSKKVGMVFQDFGLFANKSVMQNLLSPQTVVHKTSREDALIKAKAQLSTLGMLDHADKYPSQLSGGQQQRVAIGRVLTANPEYILMDEPTSALDPEMVGEILELMAKVAKQGITLVIVTHEMEFAKKVADRIVFIADGKIVEISKTADFFSKPKTERAAKFLSNVMR
ncbi:amino acid ABC transporter ATP-binding protein [Variovorax sp. RB3P1]|uniref:amino acid ABC transporter ATP-binding protein n=1 Tax=Variovorax sp. RB3P1 TaxID=3443732 RepID=UPI003F47193A